MKRTPNSKKHSQKLGFSFVELIVASTIIIILSSIWFYSYSQYMVDARDSQRISDFASIVSSMRVYKQKRWVYPYPGDRYTLENFTWTWVAYQWYLNKSVSIDTLEKIPTDPLIKSFYFYSITANRQEFQIWGSLENGWRNVAILEGTYKTVAKDVLPTLMIAQQLTSNVDIQNVTIKNKFIFNRNSHNLPYDFETGAPYSDGTTFSTILNDPTIDFWQNTDYVSCVEIWEAGKSIGSGNYQILDSTWALTSTGCTCTGTGCV